jgi:tRNA modification GTPase
VTAEQSTIFAPAAGQGRAALGVMRVSGPGVARIGMELLGRLPAPRRATLATLREPASGQPIDQALILYFPAPASFTGEDVLEIHHHGGSAVARSLTDTLDRMPNVRTAEPGEFSRRAFLNGKLDLTQVEGLADLIDATTTAQARAGLRQLQGATGRRFLTWRESLLEGLALLEAEIDFAPDEEVPDALWPTLAPSLHELAVVLRRQLADGEKGERLRRGVSIAVIGAPNVGKSSLVNALARREVAIVTELPGTTRDIIEVGLDLSGLPVTLFDTAGLRETDDPIEQAGIARARAMAADADLRLRVVDDPAELRQAAPRPDRQLTVLCKRDLWPQVELPDGALAVSVLTGSGLDRLETALTDAARALLPGEEPNLITRSRHRRALADAADALERALALGDQAELGLLAEEVRLAAQAIGKVTGHFGVEDILDRIFATFCIGK